MWCWRINCWGVNPKINNMLPAYRAALHPLVLVSDSSIKMKEDTLVDMVGAMTDNVGLVHQMPCQWDDGAGDNNDDNGGGGIGDCEDN